MSKSNANDLALKGGVMPAYLLVILALALSRPDYLKLWRTLKADSTVEEVIRNYPIRQPVLWLNYRPQEKHFTTIHKAHEGARSNNADTYSLVIEFPGFKKAVKTGYHLVADGRLTIDFTLEVGGTDESVQVTSAAGETVNTTSGEVARVVDGEQVQNLALNGRNYVQLLSLIPGAALLEDDQLNLSTSLSTTQQSINGNRGNSNTMTVDGGFNLIAGSNGSQINNVGIDFIQEVKVQTSNFSAEYGRNSGAAVNIVTRSGGNDWHGSLFEFFRNDKLDARNFFAPVRPPLRYNDFGYSLGGRIIKDKLFFFGGQEWKFIRRLSSSQLRTLPTLAELDGDFSRRAGVLRDPSRTGPCTMDDRTGCFPGNVIPAERISADGRAIANVFRRAIGLASSFTNTPTGNNTLFQQPNPLDFRQDVLRLDYRFNEKHSLYGRYLHDINDLIDPFGTFINSQLPTIPSNRVRPGTSVQVAYTWLLRPTLINEAKVNTAWVGQRIPPVGDLWKRETFGFTFPQLFSGGGRFKNSIPDTDLTGFANFRGAARSLLSPTTDIALSDNFTVLSGRHLIKTGLMVIRSRVDQNGRTTYAGNVMFSPQGNSQSTGNAFADALLGNFRTYSEATSDPIGFFRFTQFELYALDSWKVNRKLSVEYGVRYIYAAPMYTQANNIVNFDPARYDPARAVTLRQNGTIDLSRGGDRFNGLVRAGNGVPNSELGRVPNGNSPQVLAVPAGAPRGLYQTQHRFAPRLSFAYAPFDNQKTVVRGGFGVFFDRPEGNVIFSAVNIAPYAISAQFENGNLANPAGGTPANEAPLTDIFTIDPRLRVPYTTNFSLGVQRELPRGLFVEVTYVGNLGRHLLRQPDINQPPFALLAANSALPPSQRSAINALRPYKGYSQIRERLSDSNSSYHALQLYATKRKGDFLLTTSYTWSKALGDSSGNAENTEEAFDRRFNYGPTTYDRRHIFVTTYTYSLPFFRRREGLVRILLADYEVSGITRFQTGPYHTITSSTSIGTRRADYLGGDVLVPEGERGARRYINRSAFAPPPDNRRGNSGVGVISGPGSQVWDFSLRKRWSVTEKVKMQFQADLFNAFNRVNLRDVELNVNNAGFGQFTTTGPGRNVQLGLKLTF